MNRGLSLENALKFRSNSHNKKYELNGKIGTITDLARIFKPNVTLASVAERIKRGMTIEDAFFSPPKQTGRPKKFENEEERKTSRAE